MAYNVQQAPANLDADGLRRFVEEQLREIARASTGAVAKTGDTMTGDLVLPGDPDQPLEAATKQYVDARAPSHLNSGIFKFISGTQVRFDPLFSDIIRINGILYKIPSGGVTASNGGLSASTNYYAYMWVNAGTLTIEFSATTHVKDSTAGNVGTEIKSGDPSRSLIGYVRTTAGSVFADQADARYVRSWFNENGVSCYNAQTSTLSTSSTSVVELDVASRINLLMWANEHIAISSSITSSHATLGNITYAAIGVNGTSFLSNYAYYNEAVAGYVQSLSPTYAYASATDGLVFASFYGLTGGGTASYYYRQISALTSRRG